MLETEINQLINFLNNQMESQEELSETLAKTNAMLQLTLSENFLEHPKSIISAYLWALSDMVEKAKAMNEEMLEVLLKKVPVNLSAANSYGLNRS